jgi:hypothetical protein
MSRSALIGMFVFVVAGLSGCTSPAKVIHSDMTTAVVAVPDDTNVWPFYHQDAAREEAAKKIEAPFLVGTRRVKVGEQTTSTQEKTRRDIGGQEMPKVGELVTSTNRTSTSDTYEYHLEFQTQKPREISKSYGPKPGIDSPLVGAPPMAGAPPIAPTPGVTPNVSGIQPVSGLEPRGDRMPAANDIKMPGMSPPSSPTNLPSTSLTVPGQGSGR